MSNSQMIWRFPPSSVVLASDEVHVWCAPLDQPESVFRTIQKTLSSEERKRAEGFGSATHRQRFIVGRGLTRIILSRYLSSPPEQIEFCYNDSGKPSVKTATGETTICFNLAHSEKLALYAIARNRQVGIDLEHIRAIEEAMLIASHFFSARENEELRALNPSQQLEGFFNCWTRKEAYMKAIGEGLSDSLHKVEVTLNPEGPARLLSISGDAAKAAQWSLQSIIPAPGYIAALAVEDPNVRLTCWQWPENPTSTLPIAYRQLLSGQLN